MIPLKRFGTAEEVASAALFLASDESRYITGAELRIDQAILVASKIPVIRLGRVEVHPIKEANTVGGG
jgi:NAD(P)-dependent dehydrogenase (short-subunit alcohol dehydrogenase family)